MENEPLVSVVINCLNGEEHVREAIESVFAQTYSNWEIVFWDNASTDGTGEIARSFEGKLRYFRGDEVLPLGKARNEALRHCEGDLIAFLDADDRWVPRKLERQVPGFGDPDVGLVYGRVQFFEDGLDVPDPDPTVLTTVVPAESLILNYDAIFSTVVISRSALPTFPRVFDERLVQTEDFDACVGVALRKKVIRLDERVAGYRVHGGMTSVKNLFRGAMEEEYVLGKALLDSPTLAADHPDVVQAKRRSIAWRRGLAYVLRLDGRNARREFAPFLGGELRFFLAYAASLFGVAFLKRVWEWRVRAKRGIPYVQ